jgi:bacillolysin
MKRITLITLLLVAFGCTGGLAQELLRGAPGMWPLLTKYQPESEPSFNRVAVPLAGPSGRTGMIHNGRISSHEKDAAGMDHYRYQQVHNGYPVENAQLIVHVAGGRIRSQNGKWIMDFPSGLAAHAQMSEAQALQAALRHTGANKYKWELPEEEAFLKREQNNPAASFRPKGVLVYYSGEREVVPSALRLAYKFDIYAHDPISRQIVFIDAINGTVLGEHELIHEADVPGTAQTVYSGTQSITADHTGVQYRLRETGRGGGINTYNLQTGTNYAAAVDFTDADNNWNNINAAKDEYATDAHWATEKTYDYYFSRFGRNSIDNAGMPLNSYLHYSVNYFNAFWDGSRMVYGDGDAAHGNKPLTSLDVCGHEITHGITERTSNLVYAYESGALNESFSDIFGTAIEAFARPSNTDWLVGGDFYTIRNMGNPNAFNHPDTYYGTHWYTGSGDNGGVHINSGVLNFWFYLLTQGGSGTNDHGTAYAVSGIGMNKAAAIAYRLNTFYLTPNSDYYEARIFGIQAAEDLFGAGSTEAIQTTNAFTAVGLYAPSCSPVSGLTADNIQDHTATIRWSPAPGATNYTVQYKPATGTTWFSLSPTTDTFINFSYLSAATVYDWKVRSSCNGQFSYAQFTTLPPICTVPGSLESIVADTTATLSWNPTNYGTSFTVEYKEASGATWITAATVSAYSYYLTGLAQNTVYDWRVRGNCASDTSAFATAQFTTNTPVCATPAGLTVSYLPGLETKLSWNAVPGAQSYRLQIQWPGGGWWSPEIDEIVTDTTKSYIGFMSGLNLEWRVKANCSNNNGFYAASTLSTPCPQATALSASAITSSSATLNWTGSGNSSYGYTVQTKLSTSSTWGSSTTVSGTTLNLSNLQAGKTYDWRVRRNCINVNSVYVQSQFSTPCNTAPSGLKAANITHGSALLSWNVVSGAVSYSIQYKTAAATNWTTVNGLTSNLFQLGGLSANTSYQFRVLVNCTLGSSAYSATASFNTYCISSGVNNQEWIDQFTLGSISHTSAQAPGGYVHTGMSTNLTIGATYTGQISAGFSSAVRTQLYGVYIDFNRNGSYADPGELVANTPNLNTAGVFNFNISIPATAAPGQTSMRVVMLRQASGITMIPCRTGARGETEDYYVNLVSSAAFGSGEMVKEEIPRDVQLKIFPNPSDGFYMLMAPAGEEITGYEVSNVRGNSILNRKISAARQCNIDITRMPAGIYMLRVQLVSGKQEVLKLIKQ